MEILTHLSIFDRISLFMFMVETGLVYIKKKRNGVLGGDVMFSQ